MREEDVDNVWFRTCEAVQVRRVQVLELVRALLEQRIHQEREERILEESSTGSPTHTSCFHVGISRTLVMSQ